MRIAVGRNSHQRSSYDDEDNYDSVYYTKNSRNQQNHNNNPCTSDGSTKIRTTRQNVRLIDTSFGGGDVDPGAHHTMAMNATDSTQTPIIVKSTQNPYYGIEDNCTSEQRSAIIPNNQNSKLNIVQKIENPYYCLEEYPASNDGNVFDITNLSPNVNIVQKIENPFYSLDDNLAKITNSTLSANHSAKNSCIIQKSENP